VSSDPSSTLQPAAIEDDPLLRDRLKAKMFPETAQPPTIGRFQITGELGRGGMGVVYAGFDPELRRPVAVKLLTASEDETQTRLRREARAMARVSHPNVASVYDFGEHDGRLFIAMEFVDGKTLDVWMAQTRPGLWQLLDVFAQAARGLAAAHAEGLVHRDFKPSNAIVAADGRVRVLDFGLARTEALPDDEVKALATTLGGSEIVTHGGIAGTPAYMAPEQLRGKAATAKTDQFAFCISVFEALFGVRPFEGPTFADLVANVITGTRREVDDTALPEWLHRLLDRGLSPKAEDRFATMDALIAELDAGRLEGGLARMPPASARTRKNRARYVLLMLSMFLVVAVAVALMTSRDSTMPRTEAIDIMTTGGLIGMFVGMGVLLGAGLYRRGSLAGFGKPSVVRQLRTSVPADRVLELLVRNAGRLEYVVDDQDFFTRRLCLRVRAGFWSVGSYVRVQIDDAAVELAIRPIVPAWIDAWWRSPTEDAVARIEALLGDDRRYPPG
jgi:predicted Ser/Thr protein kinase